MLKFLIGSKFYPAPKSELEFQKKILKENKIYSEKV